MVPKSTVVLPGKAKVLQGDQQTHCTQGTGLHIYTGTSCLSILYAQAVTEGFKAFRHFTAGFTGLCGYSMTPVMPVAPIRLSSLDTQYGKPAQSLRAGFPRSLPTSPGRWGARVLDRAGGQEGTLETR